MNAMPAEARALAAANWLRERVPLAAHLTSDSRKVGQGDVFLAYPGAKHDGRTHIGAALAQGCAALLYDDADAFAPHAEVHALALSGLKQLAGWIASAWYGEPSARLFSVGITGTSGKSTCALWVAQALGYLGHRPALVGTLGAGFVNELADTGHTTPDPVELQRRLASLVAQGADALAIEVTSVAIVEGRANGLHLDVALYTNLSHDHLDYHGSMLEYRNAKARLFSWPNLACAVLNHDDPECGAMRAAVQPGTRVLSFSASGNSDADVFFSTVSPSVAGMHLSVNGVFGQKTFEAAIVGRFNADNLLGVLTVLLAAGVELDQAVKALSSVRPAPGRLEPVLVGDPLKVPLVLVDYAHKPDALEKVLAAARDIALQRCGRLTVVFGCGGDRDRSKRPVMGEIAARLADRVVVTSDNPRSEAPQAILDAILAGMGASPPAGVACEVDRRAAIASAISQAEPHDVVVIAGKGHESYQELAGVKTPFSDLEEARVALLGREALTC